ncbi:aldehyde dehydrogenase family protein [Halegenticoccus tardaugens]|uniref:aldehyde dehydrogenase family protein n=1 Tax=Halegenticoccus tardaugens TaxID=2071624 RepID=UPI00100A44D7|nr:aldehyde dehydrogenase family protein [Halegenticoccus tardaugens]
MSTEPRERYGCFVDGAYVDGNDEFVVENPSTEESIAKVADAGEAGVEAAVASASRAHEDWSTIDPAERGRILRDVAARLRDVAGDLAYIETLESGRPLSQSRALVDGGIDYFDYYGGLTDKIQGETIPVPGERLDYTVREPLGVTGHIVPWNATVLLGSRSIAPALACGNAVVAKPALEAPLSLLSLADVATEAGLPEGVFNVVPGTGEVTGTRLTHHPDVDALVFTGSVPTGRQVMTAAAENVTPVGLELGGKSPCIVFEDADLDRAVTDTLNVFLNAGQVCFATTRLFIHEEVKAEFLDRFVTAVEDLTIGAGVDDRDLGPLVSATALDTVARYVDGSIDDGATVLAGGGRIEGDGHFYRPTVVTAVDDDHPISRDEVFGPVVTVYEFSSETEVVRRANDSEYGLYAAVWTNRLDRAHRIANELEAGSVVVNEYPATFPQAPFGGYKKSGIGREKGLQAVEHYTQLKNITISLSPSSTP